MLQCAHCRRYFFPNERRCSAPDCRQVAASIKGNFRDLIKEVVRFHQLRVHGLCFCGRPGVRKHVLCSKHGFA